MLRVNAEGECREVLVEGACREVHVCVSETCCTFIETHVKDNTNTSMKRDNAEGACRG